MSVLSMMLTFPLWAMLTRHWCHSQTYIYDQASAAVRMRMNSLLTQIANKIMSRLSRKSRHMSEQKHLLQISKCSEVMVNGMSTTAYQTVYMTPEFTITCKLQPVIKDTRAQDSQVLIKHLMSPGHVLHIACQRHHMCSVNHSIICTQSRSPARLGTSSHANCLRAPRCDNFWRYVSLMVQFLTKLRKPRCLLEAWRHWEGTKILYVAHCYCRLYCLYRIQEWQLYWGRMKADCRLTWTSSISRDRHGYKSNKR